MSALANQSFVKMNGVGNEIVVVDLRARGGKIEADEARAAARPGGTPYDQLMALYPPRTPGTDSGAGGPPAGRRRLHSHL